MGSELRVLERFTRKLQACKLPRWTIPRKFHTTNYRRFTVSPGPVPLYCQHTGVYITVPQNRNKLEALRERRPPWPRQIITPILSTVKMLSLGCERLPTPLKKKKVLDHYLHHDLGMLPLLRCFFAHLLILQYPDHHQNLISSYLYYSGPVHKISSQSVHNCLSNVVHRQTNKQTDRQTNATKNITSFAKEVTM